jgi:hypothetical protein
MHCTDTVGQVTQWRVPTHVSRLVLITPGIRLAEH